MFQEKMSEENTACSVVLTESTSKKRAVISPSLVTVYISCSKETRIYLLAAPDDAKRRTDPKAI